MANVSIQGNDNTLSSDLAAILAGTITTNTKHTLTVQTSAGSTFTFKGDFNGGSGSTFPTSGTIESFTTVTAAGSMTVSDLGLSVKAFNNFLAHNDISGLEHAMFKHADNFDLTGADGTEIVHGYGGNDTFHFGAAYHDNASVYGGTGDDAIVLNGDYDVSFSAVGLNSVEEIRVKGGHTYELTTNDTNIDAGNTLRVDATDLKATDSMSFNGSDERDGNFDFHLGGKAYVAFAGGDGDDTFHGGGRLADFTGNGGNDHFFFKGGFNGSSTVNGGTGHDVVTLDGDYSNGLTFGADALVNIEKLHLDRGHSYDLTLNDNNLSENGKLFVDGSDLGTKASLTLDASASSGIIEVKGGAGDDHLIGGAGTNLFAGGHGADVLDANGDFNTFTYHEAGASAGKVHDRINGFDATTDKFNLDITVHKIDTSVTSGSLSQATFNADLHDAIGAGQLGSHDAVLFTASAGSHAGDTFLVVDLNGHAGYQSGQDLVVQLNSATHLDALTTDNFI